MYGCLNVTYTLRFQGRKYMGDAAANHMQEYCEEHGVV